MTKLDLRQLYLTENPANKEDFARLKLRRVDMVECLKSVE